MKNQCDSSDIWDIYKCNVTFREPGDPNCICDRAIHNNWEFGRNAMSHEEIEQHYYEDIAQSHMYCFKENDFTNITNLKKDSTDSYFLECNCSYCTTTSNIINNKFVQCFCCEEKIFLPQNFIKHCYECNITLCEKCHIQGRYSDEIELYCFNCRRFSIHKNSEYYFSYKFDMNDDWDAASWYY